MYIYGAEVILCPYYTMRFLYFALAIYPNANATELVLPTAHSFIFFYQNQIFFWVTLNCYVFFHKYVQACWSCMANIFALSAPPQQKMHSVIHV